MPTIKFPSVPSIDLTKFDLSKAVRTIQWPTINTEPVVQFTKDAMYITIGVGVLTFQKAQVRRHELTTAVRTSLPKLTNEAIAQAELTANNVLAFVNTRFPKKSAPTAE